MVRSIVSGATHPSVMALFFRVAFLSQKIETTKATDGKAPVAFLQGNPHQVMIYLHQELACQNNNFTSES